MLSFQPKNVTKDLLSDLPDRSRKVLVDRFGLNSKSETRTLDAIGKEYGITRERIRQIENHGLASVRDSDAYTAHAQELEEMKRAIAALGGILAERTILEELSKTPADQNHIIFLLTVGHHFDDERETADFHDRWHTDAQLAESVESALTNLYESIETNRLTPEEEFLQIFAKHLR